MRSVHLHQRLRFPRRARAGVVSAYLHHGDAASLRSEFSLYVSTDSTSLGNLTARE